MFLKLNTSMPLSVVSERLFSAASQIFLTHRSRINDSNFQNQLICEVNSSLHQLHLVDFPAVIKQIDFVLAYMCTVIEDR